MSAVDASRVSHCDSPAALRGNASGQQDIRGKRNPHRETKLNSYTDARIVSRGPRHIARFHPARFRASQPEETGRAASAVPRCFRQLAK